MLHNPVLITGQLRSRADLYRALAANTYGSHRPAPTNLDGMADLLREYHVEKVLCAGWGLTEEDTSAVLTVFADLGITLHR
ncbi:hypothetical protein [Corynebacterium halotolerans]|uniref:hypothetical protein n=1 Tax=Corynebacterium halotolerans TaxID=225326 RepID=UPI003CEF98C0